mmetsp:Transcript_70583/g.188387  ORF Transcript_70583/g.188387 Transcript_70583/m.188387 type:complete len:85 (-) Transcript_70583:20-274(-)
MQVVWQGDYGDSMYVVVEGLFSCRVQGREVQQFGPGQFFGEVGLCARLSNPNLPDLPKPNHAEAAAAAAGRVAASATVNRLGNS